MSHREETPGETRDMLESSFCKVMFRCAPNVVTAQTTGRIRLRHFPSDGKQFVICPVTDPLTSCLMKHGHSDLQLLVVSVTGTVL